MEDFAKSRTLHMCVFVIISFACIFSMLICYISSEPNQSEDDGDSSDGSARDEGGGKRPAHDDANIDFWVPNDIPGTLIKYMLLPKSYSALLTIILNAVEPNITLESGACCILDDFVKPPADLLLLEGDCLDANGEGGELDSYLVP